MKNLNSQNFRSAIAQVNELGFASIDLSADLPKELGQQLYEKMNAIYLNPSRARYYNEIAFYWPEDWSDVNEGIGSFHEQKSLKYIYPKADAQGVMTKHFGESTTNSILNFAETVKNLTVSNHIGLKNNELRLARVMLPTLRSRAKPEWITSRL